MSASQISFAEFALAQQAATDCTPPVDETAPVVVAHPVAVDGGECPGSDWSEFDRLMVLADSTFVAPLAHPWSSGGFVLAALANLRAPLCEGLDWPSMLANLRFHAARCIGAGC